MASVNVELVQSIFAAWERGDFSSVEWAHAEIEFVSAGGPEAGSGTGVAAMARTNREWLGAWEEYRVRAEEYRELDDERVLVLFRRTGRGKTSGLELGQMRTEGADLFHVRAGKVVRYVVYADRPLAFADLGIASQDGYE